MESSRALSRACRSLTLVVATAALALGISGVALAGTTSLSNTTVVYTGGAGEFNNVRVGYDTGSPGGPYVATVEFNSNYTNDAGPGCTNSNPNGGGPNTQVVWCPAGSVTQVILNGGDMDDSLFTGNFGFPGG